MIAELMAAATPCREKISSKDSRVGAAMGPGPNEPSRS